MLKAIVDQEKCIGCTLCVQICPEVFRMKGEKAEVFLSPLPDQYKESAMQASRECPVEAIIISAA